MWFLSMGLRQGSVLCSSSSRKYPGTVGTNQNRHWNHHRWHATNSMERTRLSTLLNTVLLWGKKTEKCKELSCSKSMSSSRRGDTLQNVEMPRRIQKSIAILLKLNFWTRNYFFSFSTACIQNANNTGTKYDRIMKQTAFWRGKNRAYTPRLKYSVLIFVE